MKPKIIDIITAKICPYCGKKPVLENSKVVYGKDYGLIYHCRPCKAWVGVHKGTVKPFGRLANEELRYWKKQAHDAFDPIWQAKVNQGWGQYKARNSTYEWLAKAMGLKIEHTHIGMFDVNQCKKVIEICKSETMPKTKTPVKKQEPETVTPEETFKKDVLKTIDEHTDIIKAILLDYLVTDGAELEILQTLLNLKIAVKSQNLEKIEEEPADKKPKIVLEDIKYLYNEDKISCDELLDFLVEDEVKDWVVTKGFAFVKVDTLEQQEKLRHFAETEIWPHYNQRENILM